MKKFLSLASQFVLLGGLVASTTNVVIAEDQPFKGEKVIVGTVGESGERTWNYVAEKALEEEGIEIEVVTFTDYVQPNVALADGSLDLNSFQHVVFLEDWNEANGEDLQPIGFTLVTKLGLYSDKHDSVEDIPENGIIAIPNDPTNGGRALLGLETAGLIEVDDAAGILPTVSDITDNPLNLEIHEVEAGQTALSLPDVDGAFINSGHASDAGLSTEDAIFVDTDNPGALGDQYKNIIAARSEDVDNPLYQKVVELYQQDDVAKVIIESDNGGSVPIWDGFDLDAFLETLEGAEGEADTEESAN